MRQLTVKTPYGTITRMTDIPYKYVGIAVKDGEIVRSTWSRTEQGARANLLSATSRTPNTKHLLFPVPEQAHDTH